MIDRSTVSERIAYFEKIAEDNNYLTDFSNDDQCFSLHFVHASKDWNISEFEIAQINFFDPNILYFNKEGAVQMRQEFRKYFRNGDVTA